MSNLKVNLASTFRQSLCMHVSLIDALSTNRAYLTIILYLFNFVYLCSIVQKRIAEKRGSNLTVWGLEF